VNDKALSDKSFALFGALQGNAKVAYMAIDPGAAEI
jgi:hypothetical protein